MELSLPAKTTTQTGEQYSLGKILGIWALAALPIGILSGIVFPVLSPDYRVDPLGAGVIRLLLLTVGLIWLFVLSLLIVRQEEGDLRWATIQRRLRLNAPYDPKTGETRSRLWLWVIPFVIAVALLDVGLRPAIIKLWVALFPFLAEPPGYSMDAVFKSQAVLDRLVGAWWFLGLYVVNALFNTLLGEELLFRGVLLPKMVGVFGRWRWVANGVLFGCYHLHQPWGIAASIIAGVFLYALPSWHFRSTWLGSIVHSMQSVYFALLILGVVLGLA
ncbi:MAG: CPBP family intramembrane glutamic endopeptidase [Caldilineaceae bacterium]